MNPLGIPAIAWCAVIAVFTLGNLSAAWWRPFKTCRRCDGYGKIASRGPVKRRPRPCRRCHGLGVRLRISRRLLNIARRHYRPADAFDSRATMAPAPEASDAALDALLAGTHSKLLATITRRLDLEHGLAGILGSNKTRGDRR